LHVAVVGDALAGVVNKMISMNTDQDVWKATAFDAVAPPSIGIQEYLQRIVQYVQCSSQSVVFALIYIDRLIDNHSFVVTGLNAHRLLLSAILVAAKSFDDEYYSNGFFSQVGGIPAAEINKLELEILFLLQFSTHVTPTLYAKYSDVLWNTVSSPPRRTQEYQGRTRARPDSPNSPKRWIEPQTEPPSPKRIIVTKTVSNRTFQQTVKLQPPPTGSSSTHQDRQPQVSGAMQSPSHSPFQPAMVFQFSPSILCK